MSQENIEVVQRFVERFNAGEFAWDQMDPRVVWVIDPPAFLAGTYHGHDGVRTLLGRFTEIFDEASYEVDELLDAGDSVVALGRFRVRGVQSGATGTQPIAVVLKLRDGKLVAYRAYFDREQALEAVGLRE
jgi:ketosteroid isomerase-like protein